MAAPVKNLSRTLSTAAPALRARVAVGTYGADTSGYTATGGSGEDATVQSKSLAEASKLAVRTYRQALRNVPSMRANFTIVEEEQLVRGVIRDLFHAHADVRDPAIVDMLVFKARQELREIREQWKSRHHVYKYILAYKDKLRVDEVVRATGSSEGDQEAAKHSALLHAWKQRGLIPGELQTWPQYLRWREEEEAKFASFAVDNKIFTNEQLERGGKAGGTCAIM